MRKTTTSLAAETEAVWEAYAALNRNDVAGFVSVFDPQIERIEPADFPGGGTYHGLAAVTAHISKGRGTWAEGSCEPHRFIVAGDRVIVFIHVRVRLKDETEWREGRIADVFTFRNGKAIQFRTFADEREALEWAGVEAPDAN
jgi:ketosteroid isomerase-like protein